MATSGKLPTNAVSDYLKSASGGQSYFKPIATPAKTGDALYSADQDASSQDALSWLVDILSRPEFAVTETISSFADAFDKNQVRSPLDNILNVAGAPFRGFFSTAPEDKIYGGELMQKISDISNQDNPNYDPKTALGRNESEKNVVKGVGGFALDVALDPLTYLTFGGSAAAKYAAKLAKEAQATGKTVEEVQALDTLRKQGVIKNGQVQMPTDPGFTGSLIDSYRGTTKASTPKYGLTVYDDKGFTKQGFNYGSLAGEFDTIEEGLEAIRKIQAERGGQWVDDLGKAAVDGRISNKDLPKGTSTYSINEFQPITATKNAPTAPIVAESALPEGLGVGTDVAKNRSALRTLINNASRPEGVASNRKAQNVINRIQKGDAGIREAIPTAPLDFGAYKEKVLTAVADSGFKVLRTKAGGLGAIEEKIANIIKNEAPHHTKARLAAEKSVADIRAKFPTFDNAKFEKLRAAASLGKTISKNPKEDRAVKSILLEYTQKLKNLYNLPLIGEQLQARQVFLDDLYKDYSKKFADEGPVDVFGNAIKTDGSLSPIDTFKTLTIQDSNLLKSVFGPKAFESLRRMANNDSPNLDNFNQAMDAIKQIFYKSGLLDDSLVKVELGLSQKAKLQQEVLRYIGVNYDAYRERVAASRAAVIKGESLGVSEGVQNASARVQLQLSAEDAIRYGLPGEPATFSFIANELVPEAVAAVIKSDFDITELRQIYKFISNGGILRTHPKYGEGLGLDPIRFNTYKQWNLYKQINMRVDKLLKTSGLKGEQLAKAKMRYTLTALRISEESLRNIGVPLHVDFMGNRYALGFSDVVSTIAGLKSKKDILTATGKNVSKGGGLGSTYMELLLFNATTPMAPTKLLDAVTAAINGASKAEIRAILQSTESRAGKAGVVDNGLAGRGKLGVAYKNYTKGMIKAERGLVPGSTLGPVKANGSALVEWNKSKVADNLADLILESLPDLERLAIKNSEKFKQLVDADTMVITETGLSTFQKIINDPSKIVELLQFARNPSKQAADLAATMGAAEAAAAVAAAKFEFTVGKHGVTTAEDSLGRAQAYIDFLKSIPVKKTALGLNKKFVEKMSRINQKAYKDAADDAADNFDLMKQKAQRNELELEDAELVKAIDTIDSTKAYIYGIEAKINSQILRSVFAGIGRFFQNDYLLKSSAVNLFNHYHQTGVLHKTLLARRVIDLRRLQKDFGKLVEGTETTVLQEAFNQLQKNNIPTNPEILQAYSALGKHMNEFFDLTRGGESALLGNEFFRSGAGLDYVNDILKDYDVLTLGDRSKYVDDLFNLERAYKDSMDQGKDLLTAAAGQWREWDVKDPIDFISRLNAAAIHMASDVSLVNSFIREGKAKGFVSEVPFKGAVKLISSKDSRYTKLLNNMTEGPIYVEPEVAQGFHRLEEIGRAGKGLNSKTGKVIQNYVDPVQNAWKVAITIYRPGHHFRNIVGDESMTYLAEGGKFWQQSMTDAFKIMSARKSYQDVDIIRSLNTVGVDKLPRGGDTVVTGKYGKMTVDGMYEAIFSRGLLPPTQIVEDLYEVEGVAGAFAKNVRKASQQDTKFGELAGGVSEYRDHLSRIKHFMQIIHKEQNSKVKHFATEKDLFDFAAERVAKHHPDASLLTTAESKYARRLIPFYSWTRGAIPAAMSAAAMNPGRVQIFNKASYNLSIAMGVDPNSLADPFPDDQLFPTFLTEKMSGPQFQVDGKYYGVNPGIVSWDIANLLAPALPGSTQATPNSLLSPLLGMSSPLFRIPLDMITGTSLATGSRINDYSDYVDAQIPGINYLANISGYSPTGSIFSTLQGMGPDPTFQTSAGNRGAVSQGLSALNFIFGTGISEFSKPNYQNYAEIEKRNREAPRTRSAY